MSLGRWLRGAGLVVLALLPSVPILTFYGLAACLRAPGPPR